MAKLTDRQRTQRGAADIAGNKKEYGVYLQFSKKAPPLQYSGGAYRNKEGVYAKYDNQTLFIVCFFGRRHKFFAPYAPIFIKKRDNIFSAFL
mgnify:CR=1 FL=1